MQFHIYKVSLALKVQWNDSVYEVLLSYQQPTNLATVIDVVLFLPIDLAVSSGVLSKFLPVCVIREKFVFRIS